MTLLHTMTQTIRQSLSALVVSFGLISLSGVALAATTPAGTVITNTATASYSNANGERVRTSSVELTTQEVSRAGIPPSDSSIRLMHIDPDGAPLTLNGTDHSDGAGNFTINPSFTDEDGNVTPYPATVNVSDDEFGFKAGEPVVIVVEDADENLNPGAIDTILVTG